MGKLSHILHDHILNQQWNSTEAAGEFEPLPAGEYVARIVDGLLIQGRTNGTPGYRITFEILEGEYQGRRAGHDIWLTPAALSFAKRDLGKIGVTELIQLEKPLPAGMRCRIQLTLRRDDRGAEYNRVKRYQVEGIDTPKPDAFAPVTSEGGGDGA